MEKMDGCLGTLKKIDFSSTNINTNLKKFYKKYLPT